MEVENSSADPPLDLDMIICCLWCNRKGVETCLNEVQVLHEVAGMPLIKQQQESQMLW